VSSTESDDDKLAGYAADLREGLVTHTSAWVEGIVNARVDPELAPSVVAALSVDVERALVEVSELLRNDIDEQRANPLSVIRSLVAPITHALRDAGAVAVQRDPDAERLFPRDVFDLTPGAFSDVHPDLHMPGLAWGAAKAHVHIQRRRAEGLR
jgi:hypothetical protein